MAQMKTNRFDIDSLRIASPCHVGWDSMLGDERVRHCDSCKLNVFNIAELTSNEVQELLIAREGRLCIRMFRRADGTVITKDCPVGLQAYQKRVAKVAGAALTAILGLFSVSFGQKGDGRTVDASRANIVRTINDAVESELCGVVLDAAGAMVAGARITLRMKGAEQNVTSDVHGRYSFLNIPDGVFELIAQVPGFEKYEVKNLTVGTSERLQLNIELRVDHTIETVGALGGGAEPIIETTTPSITATITARKYRGLPY